MIFEQFQNEMKFYDCTYEITVEDEHDGGSRRVSLNALRLIHEQNFLKAMEKGVNYPLPFKIKMYREIPIYDKYEDKLVPREVYVLFANNPYFRKYEREFLNES